MLNAYIPIFIFLLVAIGFALVTLVLSQLVQSKKYNKVKLEPYECGIEPVTDARDRYSVRYYLVAMSIELILNAVNINLIAFSYQLQNGIGQVFAIFVIAVAAAEAAVGLGIILAFYRNKETINIDEMNLMRW